MEQEMLDIEFSDEGQRFELWTFLQSMSVHPVEDMMLQWGWLLQRVRRKKFKRLRRRLWRQQRFMQAPAVSLTASHYKTWRIVLWTRVRRWGPVWCLSLAPRSSPTSTSPAPSRAWLRCKFSFPEGAKAPPTWRGDVARLMGHHHLIITHWEKGMCLDYFVVIRIMELRMQSSTSWQTGDMILYISLYKWPTQDAPQRQTTGQFPLQCGTVLSFTTLPHCLTEWVRMMWLSPLHLTSTLIRTSKAVMTSWQWQSFVMMKIWSSRPLRRRWATKTLHTLYHVWLRWKRRPSSEHWAGKTTKVTSWILLSRTLNRQRFNTRGSFLWWPYGRKWHDGLWALEWMQQGTNSIPPWWNVPAACFCELHSQLFPSSFSFLSIFLLLGVPVSSSFLRCVPISCSPSYHYHSTSFAS